MTEEFTYDEVYFRRLAMDDRRVAERLAKKFARRGGPILLAKPAKMTNADLAAALWDHYRTHAVPIPAGGFRPPRQRGRPRIDWSNSAVPFAPDTIMLEIWGEIQKDPHIWGFEDRLRMRLMERFPGRDLGFTFAQMFRFANHLRQRGWNLYVSGGMTKEAIYKIRKEE